jgi:hypothetical protein
MPNKYMSSDFMFYASNFLMYIIFYVKKWFSYFCFNAYSIKVLYVKFAHILFFPVSPRNIDSYIIYQSKFFGQTSIIIYLYKNFYLSCNQPCSCQFHLCMPRCVEMTLEGDLLDSLVDDESWWILLYSAFSRDTRPFPDILASW